MSENELFFIKYQKHICDLGGTYCRLLDISKAEFVKCECVQACAACGVNVCAGCGSHSAGGCEQKKNEVSHFDPRRGDIALSAYGKEFCEPRRTHLYGAYEAARWGGKYIYYCPKGWVFIAVTPVRGVDAESDLSEASPSYAAILGPMTMGGEDGIKYEGIPDFTPKQVNALAELASLVFSGDAPVNAEPSGLGYVFEFGDVKHTDTIYKVTAYIRENYMRKLTLDEIAGHVYLSKSYLSRIFKNEIKCSLTEYINALRVEKIKMLLRDQALSLCDIANMTGFDDQSYFTKIFKKYTGTSPGKYREKNVSQK